MALQCYRTIGETSMEKGAAERTLERVEKVIAAEPDHGSAMSFGVTALVTLGDAARAKEWAERAVLLDPGNDNLRYNLACSMVQLGDIDAALRYLESALRTTTVQGLAWIEKDSDLDAIREDPRFTALLAAVRARHAGNTRT